MAKITRASFRRALLEAFPKLERDVAEADGLVHLEVGAFLHLTEVSIENRRWGTVRQCLEFVDRVLPAAGTAVGNALYTSYLESLYFSHGGHPRMQRILHLTPPGLRRVFRKTYGLRLRRSTPSVAKR